VIPPVRHVRGPAATDESPVGALSTWAKLAGRGGWTDKRPRAPLAARRVSSPTVSAHHALGPDHHGRSTSSSSGSRKCPGLLAIPCTSHTRASCAIEHGRHHPVDVVLSRDCVMHPVSYSDLSPLRQYLQSFSAELEQTMGQSAICPSLDWLTRLRQVTSRTRVACSQRVSITQVVFACSGGEDA
jgi:hypothetical protein